MTATRKIAIPIAAIAVLTAALLLAPSVMNVNFAQGASHKDFGQCNKTFNKANHGGGKVKSDARKAACSSLKPKPEPEPVPTP